MSLLLLTLIIEHQLGLVERWVLPDNSCITIHVDIFVYYMAIVVYNAHSDWPILVITGNY